MYVENKLFMACVYGHAYGEMNRILHVHVHGK